MSCLRFHGSFADCMGEPFKHSSPEDRESYTERLVGMAHSDSVTSREVAAGNPRTPVATLEVLSCDPVASVRSWVLRNPKCPRALKESLTKDPVRAIAVYAEYLLQ